MQQFRQLWRRQLTCEWKPIIGDGITCCFVLGSDFVFVASLVARQFVVAAMALNLVCACLQEAVFCFSHVCFQ
jgi:hypothetical protein